MQVGIKNSSLLLIFNFKIKTQIQAIHKLIQAARVKESISPTINMKIIINKKNFIRKCFLFTQNTLINRGIKKAITAPYDV
jgi:hypothetical protein